VTIKVVHDFICPWCWVGLFQAQRLQKEFGVEIEWIGGELFPEELAWPEPAIRVPDPPNRPATKSRFEFLKYIEGIEVPKVTRPPRMRSHNAHLAVEFAKMVGKADQVVEALYRAYYESGQPIGELETAVAITGPIVGDEEGLRRAIDAEQGAETFIHFDDPAYAEGIYNVPTFFIGDERLAEQPYGEIRAAMERLLSSEHRESA